MSTHYVAATTRDSIMSKPPNPLPKMLKGVVLPQMVRCGKPNCTCASGNSEDLHGPYYYRFWREDGRLRKQYVPLDEVEEVRAACKRRQRAETIRRSQRRKWMAIFRELTDVVRDIEATIHA